MMNERDITMESKSELVSSHYGLIEDVLNHFIKSRRLMYLNCQYRDDFKSAGSEALIRAAEFWDPERGVTFRTYASSVIRQELLNLVRSILKIKDNEVNVNTGYLNSFIDSEESVEGNYKFTLVDLYEPEDEISKAIYHRLISGDDTAREVAVDFDVKPASIRKRKSRLLKELKRVIDLDEIIKERNAYAD